MKKWFGSISVFVYFAFSCGVMVNYHYCMDTYSSFRLYKPASDYCSKCGMNTKHHGCCHDVVKIVKLTDDQQFSSVHIDFNHFQPASLPPDPTLMLGAVVAMEQAPVNNHSPPGRYGPPIYLRNRVFRI